MSDQFLDDEMLVARAREGDRSSLNALIRKHETRAYHYAFRLTRNPEEAADVVAEGFLRVFNALPNFKGQSAFTTWLYRIRRIATLTFASGKRRDRRSAWSRRFRQKTARSNGRLRILALLPT